MELQDLGKMYASNVEDEEEYKEMVFMKDFKGRWFLKIVTENYFEPLMDDQDPKAENIMRAIYKGKESTKCDGNIQGYSSLTHILRTSAPKTRMELNIKFFTNSFKPNYDVNYYF